MKAVAAIDSFKGSLTSNFALKPEVPLQKASKKRTGMWKLRSDRLQTAAEQVIRNLMIK